MGDRKRLTERRRKSKKKESRRDKNADPYTMNQDRDNQYPEHKYMIGDPSAFADVPHDELPDDESLGRNEIGMYNMPDWAYDHKNVDDWGGDEPYDNADTFSPEDLDREPEMDQLSEVGNYRHASESSNWYEDRKQSKKAEDDGFDRLKKKAYNCVRIAENLLGDDADDKEIEDQAYDLMPLPDKSVLSTVERLIEEEKSSSPKSEEEAMLEEMLQQAEDEEDEDEEDEEEEDDEEEKESFQEEDMLEEMYQQAEDEEDDEEDDDDDDEEEDEEMDEEETEALIDEVLEEQSSASRDEAEQVVEEMTGESSQAPHAGDGMDVELTNGMDTVGEPSQEAGKESEELRQLFQEDLPEGARQHSASQNEAFSGRSQTSESSESEGVSTLGGSVKQASDSEADELEKLWEHGDDVSENF